MSAEFTIRKLARKVENINLFSAAKEINGIYLFKNRMDFSKLQKIYLSYLYFYYDLYLDINLKKIKESVIGNEIDEDAYSYYKREKPEDNTGKKKERDIHLVFSKNKKKKNSKKEVE